MIIYIILLPFCCVIGEDLQQMEPDTVLKGPYRFLRGLIIVLVAVKIGPQSDTDLFLNYLVPFEESRFVKQVLVKSEICIASLPLFL